MAIPDPYWTDGRGNRLPRKPCPKCGANVGPMPLRVEHLRNLGWRPYEVQCYQSWCGHSQEIIPFPRPDGSVLFVPVIGEVSSAGFGSVVESSFSNSGFTRKPRNSSCAKGVL